MSKGLSLFPELVGTSQPWDCVLLAREHGWERGGMKRMANVAPRPALAQNYIFLPFSLKNTSNKEQRLLCSVISENYVLLILVFSPSH